MFVDKINERIRGRSNNWNKCTLLSYNLAMEPLLFINSYSQQNPSV